MNKLNRILKTVIPKLDSCGFSSVQQWIFPLSFVFSSFVNLGFFYVGLAFEDNAIRSLGYILLCIAFAVLTAVSAVHTLYHHPLRKGQWVLLGMSVGFFLVCFAGGLLRNGFGGVIFSYLRVFIVLVIPSFLAACVFGMSRKEAVFFSSLEQLGFFSLPVVLLYTFWAIFNCNPFYRGTYLGFMNYMSFAYTIMPVLLAHIRQYSVEAPLVIPFINRTVPHGQKIRAAVIICYWLSIIASGTRGAYICVAAFCVFLYVNKLLRKQPSKRFFTMAATLALVLLFLIFIYTPPGFSGVGRMSSFVQNLLQGDFSTSDIQSDDVEEQIDELLQGNIVVANPNATTAPAPTKKPPEPESGATKPNSNATVPADPTESSTEPEELPEPETKPPVISDRSTYYSLAIGEFKQAPLFGMGAGGYSQKYAAYPHNIILEILCETGLVGTLILAMLMLIASWRICIHGIRDENVCAVFLFLAVYFIQANISGSVWQSSVLLCILGYGMSLPKPVKKK